MRVRLIHGNPVPCNKPVQTNLGEQHLRTTGSPSGCVVSRIEWELLGTGPYDPRNGFGGGAPTPFRGRGYYPNLPPPRWQYQSSGGGGGYYNNRSRPRGNHSNYGYNNQRGQPQQQQHQPRTRPRPFVRLSNRGGRYYFNERQAPGNEQGKTLGCRFAVVVRICES